MNHEDAGRLMAIWTIAHQFPRVPVLHLEKAMLVLLLPRKHLRREHHVLVQHIGLFVLMELVLRARVGQTGSYKRLMTKH